MEALVGLFRGTKRADMKSVELYTQKFEGFMLALSRFDTRDVEVEHAKEHLDNLREKYDVMFEHKDLEIFRPYRDLLSKLCSLALLTHDVVVLENSITKRQNEVEKNEREIEHTQT